MLLCQRSVLQIRLARTKRSVRENDFSGGRFALKAVLPLVGSTVAICEFTKYIRSDRQLYRSFNKQFPAEYVYLGVSGAILASFLTAPDLEWLNYCVIKVTREFFSPIQVWLASGFSHNTIMHWAVNTYCGWSFAKSMSRLDMTESFILGALWCGLGSVIFGYMCAARRKVPFYAIGASGGVCGLLGNMAYKQWDNRRPTIAPIWPVSVLVIDFPNLVLGPLTGYHIPSAFSFRDAIMIFVSISLVLTARQIQKGGGVVCHAGHLGGTAGGAFAAFNTDCVQRRRW